MRKTVLVALMAGLMLGAAAPAQAQLVSVSGSGSCGDGSNSADAGADSSPKVDDPIGMSDKHPDDDDDALGALVAFFTTQGECDDNGHIGASASIDGNDVGVCTDGDRVTDTHTEYNECRGTQLAPFVALP